MERAVELDLIERSLAALDARRPDRGHTRQVPVSRYLDPDRFEAERALLRRRPVAVAHVSEIKGAGAFLRREIFGVPVLLTRAEDGRVRGFLNICRHRGTRLVDAAAGCEKRLSCPYHGWVYGLDGALLGVPHSWGFPQLDRATAGLTPLPTREAHGLIWVLPTPGDEPLDIDAWLGPLAADLAGLGLAGLQPFDPEVRTWAANWKLLAEGGLESYHFRVTHRDSIWPLFPDNVFVADAFGEHIRSVLLKRSLAELRAQDPAGWCLRTHANLLYSLFPTTVLLVQTHHVEWIHWQPIAIDQTEVHITPLVPPPSDPKAAAYWQRHRELTLGTLAEDFEIAASIQAGLSSWPAGHMRFGSHEYLLGCFHQVLEAGLAG